MALEASLYSTRKRFPPLNRRQLRQASEDFAATNGTSLIFNFDSCRWLLFFRSDLHGIEYVDTYYLRTERLFNVKSTRFLPWYARAQPATQIRRANQFSDQDHRSDPSAFARSPAN